MATSYLTLTESILHSTSITHFKAGGVAELLVASGAELKIEKKSSRRSLTKKMTPDSDVNRVS